MKNFFNVAITVSAVFLMGLGLVTLGFTSTGLRPMYVVSESMEPLLHRGDLVLRSSTELVTPCVGDIVSFEPPWYEGKTVTHRLISIDGDKIITKGDNNSFSDPPISEEHLTGVIVGKARFLGWLYFPVIVYSISSVLLLSLGIEIYLKWRANDKVIDSYTSDIAVKLKK